MRSIDILKFMGEQGARYRSDGLDSIISYMTRMIRDSRVVVIYKDSCIFEAVIFFSIDDEVLKYLQKDTWHYLPHNPSGRTIYIEKMVSRSWNRVLRESIQEEIFKIYPNLEVVVWHRWAKWGDRKITRRIKENVRNQSIGLEGI